MSKQMNEVIGAKIDFITKILDDDSEYEIEAVATSFGNIDKDGDVVLAGALDDYIKEFNAGEADPLRMLLMHQRGVIVGEWKHVEIVGSKVVVKGNFVSETQAGKDTKVLVKKGLLPAVSMGFSASEYTIDDETFGRTFAKIALIETSLVDTPANEKAVILSVKNHAGKFDLRAIEKALRDVGLSNKEAKTFIAKGKGGLLNQREVDEKKVLKQLKEFSFD